MKRKFFTGILSICLLLTGCVSATTPTKNSVTTANTFTSTLIKGAPAFSTDKKANIGIAASSCAILDNMLVLVGGVNNPNNTFAGIEKQMYSKEVYGASVAESSKKLKWTKLGELGEPLAYAANVVTNNHLYIIGGNHSTGTRSSLIDVKMVNGVAKKNIISYLPTTITKAGAAAIGDYLYVVGGIQAGKPSNDLYRINLKNLAKGWEKLAACPDDYRVQPIVASQKDNTGKLKLYIWGGYTPAQGSKPPVISCGGYKYDPDTNKWTPVKAPLNKDGLRLYLGGGNAIAVDEDKIVTFGGYSFEALAEEQKPNNPQYYSHEAEWYKFKHGVYCYNTKTNTWSKLGELPELARINAGLANKNKDIYILFGETKPGTTTNTIMKITL